MFDKEGRLIIFERGPMPGDFILPPRLPPVEPFNPARDGDFSPIL